jgi:predicted DNA-binding transcriptional regulator AlpA
VILDLVALLLDKSAHSGAIAMNELLQTLTPIQAAKYLGISEAVLRLWRSEGKGPRHFKAGEKLIRYRKTDLDFWIEGRLSAPAAESR